MDSRVQSTQPVVIDLVLKWSDAVITDPDTEHSLAQVVQDGAPGKWRLIVVLNAGARTPSGDDKKLRIKVEVPVVFGDVPTDDEIRHAGRPLWALMKLAPTVWKPMPSLPINAGLRAHLTITGVPEPAPWEGSSLVVP